MYAGNVDYCTYTEIHSPFYVSFSRAGNMAATFLHNLAYFSHFPRIYASLTALGCGRGVRGRRRVLAYVVEVVVNAVVINRIGSGVNAAPLSTSPPARHLARLRPLSQTCHVHSSRLLHAHGRTDMCTYLLVDVHKLTRTYMSGN